MVLNIYFYFSIHSNLDLDEHKHGNLKRDYVHHDVYSKYKSCLKNASTVHTLKKRVHFVVGKIFNMIVIEP